MPEQYSLDAQNALYAKLEEIALPHVQKSDGQLSILPNSPEEFPSQALGVFYVEGDLQPPETTDGVGTIAMPRFVEMSNALLEGQLEERTLQQTAEDLLAEQQSIVVVTDHDDVTSPAYALGGFSNILRKANAERPVEKRVEFESGIIVSKMLSLLAYEVNGQAVPCMQVLRWMCDRVYLSYPRTKTFMDSGIVNALPPNHISNHNEKLKTSIDEWMAQGAVVLGESMLGTTHKSREGGRVHELKRVTKGSGEMVTRANVHLLPVIVGLTEDDRYMQTIGPFRQFNNWEDAHELSAAMAGARTERNQARGSQVVCVYQSAEQAEAERRRNEHH